MLTGHMAGQHAAYGIQHTVLPASLAFSFSSSPSAYHGEHHLTLEPLAELCDRPDSLSGGHTKQEIALLSESAVYRSVCMSEVGYKAGGCTTLALGQVHLAV